MGRVWLVVVCHPFVSCCLCRLRRQTVDGSIGSFVEPHELCLFQASGATLHDVRPLEHIPGIDYTGSLQLVYTALSTCHVIWTGTSLRTKR